MAGNNDLAPIVLFTYNRVEHTKKTVVCLKENALARQSTLIVFSDGPKSDLDKKKVQDVRHYLKSIRGFNHCTLIERETNFGLAKNIIEGVSEIIAKFGKVIVLEDDLLTSTNFLCFMNEALKYYQERQDVFAISGFTLNLKSLVDHERDTYLTRRPSSWGWATWANQWSGVDWDVSDFKEFIKDRKKIARFNRGGADMTRMLKSYFEGRNNSWAIRWAYAMCKNGKYCIYPKRSKVQNIGFGVDATHCKQVNIYKTNLDASSKCTFNFTSDNLINPRLEKEFRYTYSWTNKLIQKLKGFIQDSINEA